MAAVLSSRDTRKLRRKRRMITPKHKNDGGNIRYVTRKVWVNDDNQSTSFDLADSTVTVINLGDEYPLSSKNKDTFIQYMHGRVSVSDNRLAIGLVFRNVVGEAYYYDTTHMVLDINNHTTYDYAYLHI